MVAYSFKRRFVAPIQVGLRCYMPPTPTWPVPEPKTHTIRAHRVRGRHAREGDEVQLYCDMRTKDCFLIGRAQCTETQGITIAFRSRRHSDWLRCARFGKVDRPTALDDFARSDGFRDWQDLRAFWREEHPGVDDFAGVIIFWQPKGEA